MWAPRRAQASAAVNLYLSTAHGARLFGLCTLRLLGADIVACAMQHFMLGRITTDGRLSARLK